MCDRAQADQFKHAPHPLFAQGRAACSSSSPSPTFCSTVLHGSSVASWKIKLIISRAFSGVMPFTLYGSLAHRTQSRNDFNNVDFPHPEGPRNVTNSPRFTVREMLSSATAALRNRLLTPAKRSPELLQRRRCHHPGSPFTADTTPTDARPSASPAGWSVTSSNCPQSAVVSRSTDCDHRAEKPNWQFQAQAFARRKHKCDGLECEFPQMNLIRPSKRSRERARNCARCRCTGTRRDPCA